MPAFTPFLNLYKPGGGSTGAITPDEVVDIDRINQNMDALDNFAESWGEPGERNRAFYGTTADRAALTGMKPGDTFQESDGNKYLWRYDGSDWKIWARSWEAFTPTWTGFTPGASPVAASYRVDGGVLYGVLDITLAAGFVMGAMSLAPPIPATSPVELRPLGLISIVDSGMGYYRGRVLQKATGNLDMWYESGNNMGEFGPSVPFTWANTDVISAEFSYRVG